MSDDAGIFWLMGVIVLLIAGSMGTLAYYAVTHPIQTGLTVIAVAAALAVPTAVGFVTLRAFDKGLF